MRYVLLAAALLAANIALLKALTSATGSVLAAKLLTEPALFAASFLTQRLLIFPGRARVTASARSDRTSMPLPTTPAPPR